jgi:hypothetical protein
MLNDEDFEPSFDLHVAGDFIGWDQILQGGS